MLVQVKRITIFLKRIFYLLYLNKKLQATFVPYIDKSICEKVTVILVMGHFVQALPKEVLIHAKEIAGGTGCAEPNKYGVYADIAALSEFIASIMNIKKPTKCRLFCSISFYRNNAAALYYSAVLLHLFQHKYTK